MSEWHRLNPNSVVFVESRPMKPAFQQRAMSTASAETGGLPVPGRREYSGCMLASLPGVLCARCAEHDMYESLDNEGLH